MKLVNDIIVEENGIVYVVPKGTILEALDESSKEAQLAFMKQFFGNIKILNSSLDEFEEQIEGQQKDVDDWDMHMGVIMTGDVLFETVITFTPEMKQSVLSDRFVEAWDVDNLLDWIGWEDFHGEYIVKHFAEHEGLSSGHRDSELHIGKKDGSKIIETSLDENTWQLRVLSSFDRTHVGGEPFYRGSYRTGGNYPDA